MKWYIGCSGFSYKEWKNDFYPARLAPAKWFEFYASRFDTLEVNLTFYNFPKKQILEGWYKKSPNDFIFAVKVPRLITHYKKMVDVQSLLDDFYLTCAGGLQEKLGPVLFQFPPSFSYTESRLELLINSLPGMYKNVVEFRHRSWWKKEVYDSLGDKEIIFSGISHPDLPDDIIVNASSVYYRFHGVPQLYVSSYTEKQLGHFADTVSRKKNVKEVFCYFNNTAAAHAIHNAEHLLKYTGKGRK